MSVAMSLPMSYWPPAHAGPEGDMWSRPSVLRGAGERRHTCSTCGKAFKLKHHLVEHNVVHRDEKPFTCPLCPAAFKRSKQVKYHMRLHHRLETTTTSSLVPSSSTNPADSESQWPLQTRANHQELVHFMLWNCIMAAFKFVFLMEYLSFKNYYGVCYNQNLNFCIY